jgi:hypothetical protein
MAKIKQLVVTRKYDGDAASLRKEVVSNHLAGIA